MSLVVNGKRIMDPMPGIKTVCWLDDPHVKCGPEDKAPRVTYVRNLIEHGTQGHHPIKVQLAPDDPWWNKHAFKSVRVAKFFQEAQKPDGSLKRSASATYVEGDTIYQLADLVSEYTIHCGSRNNRVSSGNENVEWMDTINHRDVLAPLTYETSAVFAWWKFKTLGIQPQTHYPYARKRVYRLTTPGGGGRDCVGIFGHRECDDNRGEADPGNPLMRILIATGVQVFDFTRVVWHREHSVFEDQAYWMKVQDSLKLLDDGMPGPVTLAALKKAGHQHGLMWQPIFVPTVCLDVGFAVDMGWIQEHIRAFWDRAIEGV